MCNLLMMLSNDSIKVKRNKSAPNLMEVIAATTAYNKEEEKSNAEENKQLQMNFKFEEKLQIDPENINSTGSLNAKKG